MNPNDQPFNHSPEQASRLGVVLAARQAAHAARTVVIVAKRLARLYRKRLRGITGRTTKRNPRMSYLGSPFTQRRSEALRAGALLDITATALATGIGMPSAVSPALWRAVADDAPCRAGDPRVICLCWCLFLFVTSKAYDREERGPHHRIVWFEATVLGRRVAIKAIAHRDEHFEPVMTLLCADEPDPFSK